MSHLLFLFSLFIILPRSIIAAGGGRWQLLQKSIGISAMHMQLLNDDRVIIYDRTDFGPSNLTLANGKCFKKDCTAHSAIYNSISNTFRPLTVLTNNWCSSGATLPNGTLVQSGGYRDGERVVRTFQPSYKTCDWVEIPKQLLQSRWYATNHALPDGRMIIVGGTKAFNYEFYPKTPSSKLFTMPFLKDTTDPKAENNLYPFVFLHVDGNLFIFANNRAILFDYTKNEVVRTYPTIPGGDPRSYPSTGSAVLLPLKNIEMGSDKIKAEVLICGGAPAGSYLKALKSHKFLPALNTCARMRYTDPNPTWTIETMPMARVMSDMVVLPNGDVLIINGAGKGSAGWELGREPVLTPMIYHPNEAPGSRFELQNPATIPRMYHSCAILLRDGRVLVGGSNPHAYYNFTNVLFPTELSLETFSPPYLDSSKTRLRPVITTKNIGGKIKYKKNFTIKFSVKGLIKPDSIKVTMLRPPFNTHSFSMSQRMLVLTKKGPIMPIGLGQYKVKIVTPRSTNIAPPGFYMIFVVHQNIPSKGIWVQLT